MGIRAKIATLAAVVLAAALTPFGANAGANDPFDFLLAPLSEASRGLLLHADCSSEYSEERARTQIKTEAVCKALSNGLVDQAMTLKGIGIRSEDQAMDQMFGLLAEQHSKELTCSANFARGLSSGLDQQAAGIMSQLDALHAAKQGLIQASNEASQNPRLFGRPCPVVPWDLKPEPQLPGQEDVYFKHCSRILAHRAAYDAALNTLPLGNSPSIAKFADEYANMSMEDFNRLGAANRMLKLKLAYQAAAKEFDTEAARLKDTNRQSGGSGFDRSTRRALLSDPRVTETVLKSYGGGKDLEGLACKADAQYGRGADDLGTVAFWGGAALSFGGGALFASGAGALKVAVAANTARTAGLISVNASRALLAAAVTLETVNGYSQITQSCSTQTPKLLSDSGGNMCVSAPTLEQVARDNCVLSMIFSGLGVAAPGALLAQSLAFKAPGAFRATSELESFILPARASDLVKAGRLEQMGLVKSGSRGEIIALAGTEKSELGRYVTELNGQKIRIFDASATSSKEAYEIKQVGDEIHVFASSKFFENPEQALRQLRRVENMVDLKRTYAQNGVDLDFMPNATSDNFAVEIMVTDKLSVPTEYAKSMEWLGWARTRNERHGITVVVDDSEFKGQPLSAAGFARRNTVYLRSSALESPQTHGPLLGHEIAHALRYQNCLTRNKCAPAIEFRTQAKEGFSTLPDLYGNFFRADELEAYVITGRFNGNDATSLAHAAAFGREQSDLLTVLKQEIEQGQHTVNIRRPTFSVQTADGPVSITVPNAKLYSSEEEARRQMVNLLDQRIEFATIQLNHIQKRMLNSPAFIGPRLPVTPSN